MRISSWAAMTKRHRGGQWHCRTIRTINLDYVSPPQAMQWPDARSKHTRQWLGCGNSIPRCGFPISKMCGALGGKTSRDTKKDCGKPGCPNDHRSQVLAVRVRLPLMALFGRGVCAWRCPFIGAKRKSSALCEYFAF